MKLKENKSRTWFKVLSAEGAAMDGSGEQWQLPTVHGKGRSLDFSRQQAYWHTGGIWYPVDRMLGTWLVSDPKEVYGMNSGQRIFIAEVNSLPLEETIGVVWAGAVRLVREATNLDLKRYGIYRAFKETI